MFCEKTMNNDCLLCSVDNATDNNKQLQNLNNLIMTLLDFNADPGDGA